LAQPADEAAIRQRFVQHFGDLFEAETTFLEHQAAHDFLDEYLQITESELS
jgi:hypothetical protein